MVRSFVEPRWTFRSALIIDPSAVYIVQPTRMPNANWLRPEFPSAGQRAFGDALLSAHSFVLIPSAAPTHRWNLLFDRDVAKGLYRKQTQEDFGLDTRLHSPSPERSGVPNNRPRALCLAHRFLQAGRLLNMFAKPRRAPRVESVRYGAKSDA